MANTLAVLSAGAIRRGVAGVAGLFERTSGHRVVAEFTSAPKVRARVLAGEVVDVVVASSAAFDALEQDNGIMRTTRAPLGRTGMAVMIRRGTNAPDLADTDAFIRAMLGADAVVYNEGSSGAHAAAIIERLGLRERLGERIRVVPSGAEMVGLVGASGGAVFGLAQTTNILDQMEKGSPVALAGVFPEAIQIMTTYEAAVASASSIAELAETFVRTFASADARRLLAAAGLD